VREYFENAEQGLEVISLALERLAEPRRNGKRGDAIGGVFTRPSAGHIGLSGGFVIVLLVRPVIVFNGQATGLLVAAAANGSTCLWIGCARPIHGSGRMQRTQSAKLGMKPISSTTCCSPISAPARCGVSRS
jgi:hypothetical protein